MKYNFSILVLLLSLKVYSQIPDSITLAKEFQEFKLQNTVTNLMKYNGQHKTKSVDEYQYVNDNWVLTKTDTTPAEINYYDCYITFKRSYFKEPLIRFLYFDSYDGNDNFYSYSSTQGKVNIYGKFKTVVLFDKPDTHGKPTNKYVFNF